MKVLSFGGDARFTGWINSTVHQWWPGGITSTAYTAGEGLLMVETETPDIVLVDSDYLDVPLTELIKELRSFSRIPLLVLSYEWDDQCVVSALASGADDYLRMPCHQTELMIRILALLRRSPGGLKRGPLIPNYSHDGIYMDGPQEQLDNLVP